MLLSGHIRREAGIVLFVSGWISQCHIAFLASTATLIPHVVMAFWQMLMIWHKWFRDAGQGAVFRISGFYHLLAYGLEGQVCLSRFLNFVKLILLSQFVRQLGTPTGFKYSPNGTWSKLEFVCAVFFFFVSVIKLSHSSMIASS